MADFAAIYFIKNNAGTYEAYDSEGNLEYSGTNLVTNVLNSIESAHSSGNFTVMFGVGTFNMGTDNWTLNTVNDVTLAGVGIDITIISNSSTAAADTEPFSFTNCDRITIRDLTISAGGTARSTSDALDLDNADDCLVERVKISTSRGSGIVIDGKDAGAQAINNTIRDCLITGADLEGIQLLAADNSLIEGCSVYTNGEVGIKLNRKTSATVQSCQNTIIKGCRIYDNAEAGIEVLECDRTIIEGNIIYNNGTGTGSDDGILVDDFATAGLTTTDVIIKGNIIYDDQGTKTQDTAIKINDAVITGVIIEGNIIGDHIQTDEAKISDLAADTIIRGNQGYPDKVAQEKSAAYTLTITDPPVLNVDSSGGTRAITLPDNAAATGRSYIIIRDGASNVTVDPGTDTFSDTGTSTDKTLGSDGAAIGLVSIGDGEWKVVSTEGTVT